MKRVGMLHTVPSLAQDFDARAKALLPGVEVIHLADASLLVSAADGVDDALIARIVGHCHALEGMGCEAILVTCSSIGAGADEADQALDAPVLWVDRPMAQEAARLSSAAGAGGRIAVMATLECTLGPSVALVKNALESGSGVEVVPVLCVGAAEARAAGDDERHNASIVNHMSEVGEVDAIVLAQASMAGAVGGVAIESPILTSPEGGMHALAVLAGTVRE